MGVTSNEYVSPLSKLRFMTGSLWSQEQMNLPMSFLLAC